MWMFCVSVPCEMLNSIHRSFFVFFLHLVPVFLICLFQSPTCLCLFSSFPAFFVLSDEWIPRLKSLAHPSWRRRVMFGLKWVTKKTDHKYLSLRSLLFFFPSVLCGCAGFVMASFGAAMFFFYLLLEWKD